MKFAIPFRRLSIPALLCLTLLSTAGLAKEPPPERVSKIKDDGTETIWRIERPHVKNPRTEYKQITFRKYDEVTIRGGGCVQTGGSGRTWKRYMDPSGPNSDRLYHGRIWIPGATDGLIRISGLVAPPVTEPLLLVVNRLPEHPPAANETNPYFLRLGYEDDKHSDNGYDRHDDGTDDQCTLNQTDERRAKVADEDLWKDDPSNNGNAWLEIRIRHHADSQSAPTTPSPRAPFDLWWERVDDNFLPFNPDWWMHRQSIASGKDEIFPNSNDKKGCDQFREGRGDQLLKGRDPDCTLWDPDVDEANALSSFCHLARLFANSVHGHINWGAVTYDGKIYFDVANNGMKFPGVAGDGDYDWLLVTENNNGVAKGNVDDSVRAAKEGKLPKDVSALALEFSSRETIDRFKKSAWWDAFHHNVDHNDAAARDTVKGKQAIVIGLIGFDNEHGNKPGGARVELHPVWGLAIKDDHNPAEEVWAIFARNWGNEGSCSNGWDLTGGKWKHYLPLHENKMKFFLPVALGPNSIVTPQFYTDYGPSSDKFTSERVDGGLLLTIQLPEPEKHKLFWGELHIKK